MLRTALLLGLLAASVTAAGARDETACLPRSLFPKNDEASRPKLNLGFSGGVPTLCAPNDPEQGGYAGCWTVDAGTGALAASTATHLSGRSRRSKAGSDGCIEGYCPTSKSDADRTLLFAASTDGAHATILVNRALHVFDARTKAQSAVISLDDEKAPGDTNVSNEPVDILYLGDTLYVVGSDAGPYVGVWAYKDDGRRLGVVKDPRKANEEYASYSVYNGAATILDDRHVAFADAALRTMRIFDAAGGTPEDLRRPVTSAPCTAKHMVEIELGDVEPLPKGCKAIVEKNFRPYFDVDPIRLPSGDLLAALSGRYRGALAVLDGRTLVEKRRLRLRRCRD